MSSFLEDGVFKTDAEFLPLVLFGRKMLSQTVFNSCVLVQIWSFLPDVNCLENLSGEVSIEW